MSQTRLRDASGAVPEAASTFRVYTSAEIPVTPLRASFRPSQERSLADEIREDLRKLEAVAPRTLLLWFGAAFLGVVGLFVAFVIVANLTDDVTRRPSRVVATVVAPEPAPVVVAPAVVAPSAPDFEIDEVDPGPKAKAAKPAKRRHP